MVFMIWTLDLAFRIYAALGDLVFQFADSRTVNCEHVPWPAKTFLTHNKAAAQHDNRTRWQEIIRADSQSFRWGWL